MAPGVRRRGRRPGLTPPDGPPPVVHGGHLVVGRHEESLDDPAFLPLGRKRRLIEQVLAEFEALGARFSGEITRRGVSRAGRRSSTR